MAHSIGSLEYWKIQNANNLNSFFLSNVCRLCASISDNVVPIFDKTNDNKGSIGLYVKLKKCLPSMLIAESDLKPKQICASCVSKLDSYISFQEMSGDADSKFESLLQSKIMSQIQILNDSLLNDKSSFPNNEVASGFARKEETPWTAMRTNVEISRRDASKGANSSNAVFSTQIHQQKAISQQVMNAVVPVHNSSNYSSGEDGGVLVNKQESGNYSILQNLLTQDGLPSQDVVVLFELKYKDMAASQNSAMINKKTDLPQQLIPPPFKVEPMNTTAQPSNQQTKIVDTNGHIRVINLSDFDGKFNHFDKIASSFVNDNISEKPTNNANSILKAFETDILSALKLDNFTSDNSTSSSPGVSKLPPKYTPSYTATPANTSMHVSLLENARKCNQQCIRDFGCDICGKQFTRRNRLNAHLARHSSERPHCCDKCDQRFITRWDLTLHLRIHSGIFSCEFCGKAFPAKGKLERHRRTHTGERPFPCTLCNRAFSEKRNLKNHLKTHALADSRKNLHSNCVSCGWQLVNINNSQNGRTTCDTCSKNGVSLLNNMNMLNKQSTNSTNCSIAKDGSHITDGMSANNNSMSNVSVLVSHEVSEFLKT